METTQRTSPSRQPVPAPTNNYANELNITTEDEKHVTPVETPVIGHQLCEFCRPYGEKSHRMNSICDCNSIRRRVAGGRSLSPSDDLSIRVAEEAILNKWQLQTNTPHDETVIIESLVSGAINGDKIIRVAFEGRLCNDLSESYECDRGTAQIQSFTSDGYVNIRISLTDSHQ